MKRCGLVAALVASLCACGAIEGAGRTGSSGASSIQHHSNGATIDADVFAYREGIGASNERFVLTGAADQARAMAAVAKAGARFMRVDETGKEYPDDTSLDAAYLAGLYTPNYVSDPRVTAEGVELYIDCKGSIEPPMVLAFRKILQEELDSAGVFGRVRAVN
jgi:hypothetical protein